MGIYTIIMLLADDTFRVLSFACLLAPHLTPQKKNFPKPPPTNIQPALTKNI